jgi:hypothetical protein
MNVAEKIASVIILVLLVSTFLLVNRTPIEDQKQWIAFVIQHKCKFVAHVSGERSVGTYGQISMEKNATPGKD